MPLHRVLTDAELSGDIAVLHAARTQKRYFALALRKPVDRRRLLVLFARLLFGHRTQHLLRDLIIESDLAGRNRADSGKQALWIVAFQHQPARTQPYDLHIIGLAFGPG